MLPFLTPELLSNKKQQQPEIEKTDNKEIKEWKRFEYGTHKGRSIRFERIVQ